MSQAGFTPISLYYSLSASAIPSAGNLTFGELAINVADKKLYSLDSLGNVFLLASASNNGTVTSVNVSGGTTGLTTSGGPVTTTGTITLAGVLSPANGGTGVNNVSNTLTLTGNLVTSGGYNITLTGTGATNITLPTSGTLATLLPRVVNTATATSITINGDTTDVATMANTQTAGTFTVNAPSGTPANGQKLIFRLSSTAVQTFSWNAIFQGSSDVALPTVSSSGGKYDYMGFIYNSTATKWQMVASNFGF